MSRKRSWCYFTDGSRKVILDAWRKSNNPQRIYFTLNDGIYAYEESTENLELKALPAKIRTLNNKHHNFYLVRKAELVDTNIANMWNPDYWKPLYNIERIEVLDKDFAH
jgi:hypothetical protein